MGKTSMMIRLIDIGLTVLFGFICVADIEQKTQLKLPSHVTAISTPTTINTVSLLIFDGPRYTLLEGGREIVTDTELERIEDVLLDLRQRYLDRRQDIVVLVQPDPNSPIQLTVYVLDICERNHLQKNINYVEPGV